MRKYNKPVSGDVAVQKSVSLFIALVREGQERPLSALAAERGIALSTAYRLIQPFLNAGLLTKPKRQCYMAGPSLFDLARTGGEGAALAAHARPVLSALTKALGKTVHLGVWAEDMVTYVVKAAGADDEIFTQEGMQLEAYCSAIGKVLLAHKPRAAQEAYLANGPFIALTDKTITDPAEMQRCWGAVAQQGFAEDIEEISDGLRCIAVPIFDSAGGVRAALSISSHTVAPYSDNAIRCLKAAAVEIKARVYGGANP